SNEGFNQSKLVISASYPQNMRNLVGNQIAPFYKQLLLREIEPFSESEYKDFLQHYLPSLKFTRDAVREQLYRITSGIPYNLQLLGSEIQLQGLNDLSSEKLSGVVDGVLRKEGELSFKEFVDDLTPSEVKVLRALARSSEDR